MLMCSSISLLCIDSVDSCGQTGFHSIPFQILDIDPEDQAEEDGGHTDLDSQRKGKCVVIKTSTRQVNQPSSCHPLVWHPLL